MKKKVTPKTQTRWTPKKRDAFLESLAVYGNVTEAARQATTNRTYLYALYDKDPKFKAAWDAAAKVGAQALEDEARRRAYEGVKEPKFNKDGITTEWVQKYSDTLLIFLLKGHDPDKYKDRVDTHHTGEVTMLQPVISEDGS